MNAHTPIQADAATVRTFLDLLHAQAARALYGAKRPGLLQLVRVHPARVGAVPSRFTIGAVDRMVEAALGDAASGHNVYVEPRTVERIARGRGRADAHPRRVRLRDRLRRRHRQGRGLAIQPSLVVETSPGNRHLWLFLDRALAAGEAMPIGKAIRRRVKADSDTGVITQPYRVAGTPNYPNARKQARGRIEVAQTRILEESGIVWSREALLEAFPPQAEAEPNPGRSSDGPAGRTGRTSLIATMLLAEIATPVMDRSVQFHAAVKAAVQAGLSFDDLEQLARQHPQGCASKYLEGRDRLREEIERSWLKAKAGPPPAPSMRADLPGHVPCRSGKRASPWRRRFAGTSTPPGDMDAEPPVHAIRVATGVGKTRIAAQLIAEDGSRARAAGGLRPFLYAVPTHRLGEDIADAIPRSTASRPASSAGAARRTLSGPGRRCATTWRRSGRARPRRARVDDLLQGQAPGRHDRHLPLPRDLRLPAADHGQARCLDRRPPAAVHPSGGAWRGRGRVHRRVASGRPGSGARAAP